MEPLTPKDPRNIGPFSIIARLGSGGMGVVFLGSKGSQRVAVKVVRSSFLDSPALKTRFEREIETLKKIRSPYVARYLDSDIEGELAWHAVEFVNGPTLKERIELDKNLSADEWWAFYSQIRDALDDIHRAGVIHRDLKPSNIILSESGIRLIDFGISHDADATSITTTGMVAGSPAWLSPEQLAGTAIGPGSDMFSAGSILVYAALGRSPWGNETTMTVPVVYQRILTRDFNLDNLSGSMREAVKPLLAEDERNRAFVEVSSVTRHAFTEISNVAELEIGELATQKEPGTPNRSKPLSPPATRSFRTALWLVGGLATAASVAIVAVLARMESGVVVSEAAPAAETYAVYALLPQGREYPYGITYLPPMEAKAVELGINLTITNSEYDGDKQASECEVAIAAKPDGIILWPGSLDVVTPCLTAADAAGIPVWISVADVDEADKPLTYGYSGTDGYGQGAASAEIMCEIVGGAEIGIIQINGFTGNSIAQLRGDGFKDTVASNCPNVTILAEQPGDWNVDASQTAAAEMLTSVGVSNVQGMYAADDTMVKGGIDAFKARDIAVEDLFITSIGNSFLGNHLVGSGELDGTIFHSSSWDGENAVTGIYAAITGATKKGRDDGASVRYMPNPRVTIDNWDDVAFKPEW